MPVTGDDQDNRFATGSVNADDGFVATDTGVDVQILDTGLDRTASAISLGTDSRIVNVTADNCQCQADNHC